MATIEEIRAENDRLARRDALAAEHDALNDNIRAFATRNLITTPMTNPGAPARDDAGKFTGGNDGGVRGNVAQEPELSTNQRANAFLRREAIEDTTTRRNEVI